MGIYGCLFLKRNRLKTGNLDIVMNNSECRIIVPIYQSELSHDQEISLASIRKHLSGYVVECWCAVMSQLKQGEFPYHRTHDTGLAARSCNTGLRPSTRTTRRTLSQVVLSS